MTDEVKTALLFEAACEKQRMILLIADDTALLAGLADMLRSAFSGSRSKHAMAQPWLSEWSSNNGTMSFSSMYQCRSLMGWTCYRSYGKLPLRRLFS
jgi:hypothetical protein